MAPTKFQRCEGCKPVLIGMEGEIRACHVHPVEKVVRVDSLRLAMVAKVSVSSVFKIVRLRRKVHTRFGDVEWCARNLGLG